MAVFLVRNYYQEKFIRLKKITSIQLKAAFLLIVFSLNTIVGFACAIGMDMGFNTSHHHEVAIEQSVHIHADGKKHVHQTEHTHHDEVAGHHHNESANGFNKATGEDDNCCTDAVVKITQSDKLAPQSADTIFHPFFFTAFISSFYYLNALYASHGDTKINQFVRSYHPPIPDIRVAIQSFQI